MPPVSEYTEKLADTICDRLAAGESLRRICADDDMPAESTVYKWLQVQDAFVEKYTRARTSQAERMLDEILEIADDARWDTELTDNGPKANAEWISRSKLRVDTRKWAMAKLAPKKYGDKLDLTSDGDKLPAGAAVFQIVPASQRPTEVAEAAE